LFQCRRRDVLYVADACSSVDVGGCSTLASYGVRSRVSGASISEAYAEDGSEAYQLRVTGQVLCAQAACPRACAPEHVRVWRARFCSCPCVCVRARAHVRELPALTPTHSPHHVLALYAQRFLLASLIIPSVVYFVLRLPDGANTIWPVNISWCVRASIRRLRALLCRKPAPNPPFHGEPGTTPQYMVC
jgi:hypothetical protein